MATEDEMLDIKNSVIAALVAVGVVLAACWAFGRFSEREPTQVLPVERSVLVESECAE